MPENKKAVWIEVESLLSNDTLNVVKTDNGYQMHVVFSGDLQACARVKAGYVSVGYTDRFPDLPMTEEIHKLTVAALQLYHGHVTANILGRSQEDETTKKLRLLEDTLAKLLNYIEVTSAHR